jgi:predicted secreted Zn-dependent protease
MQNRFLRQAVCCAIASLATSIAADCKAVQSTKYIYYSISGNSPATIFVSLVKHGPRVGSVRAYASTTVNASQAGQMQQGKICEIKNYTSKMDFTIRLPKLQNEAVLTGVTRSGWENFSAAIRMHEENRRGIWLSCAAALEAEVKAIRMPSCKQADAKVTALWNQMKASCARKQFAYDAQRKRAILRHPFIQNAFKHGNQ